MAKTSIKVTADTVQSNKGNSSVRFVVEVPPAPPAKPGDAPVRLAKTVVMIQYTDSASATVFEVGKSYTIIIEG